MREAIRPRRGVFVIAIVIGILVAIPLPLAAFGAFGSKCGPGNQVATLSESITPWVIVNSPLFGKATGTHIAVNGSSTVRTTFGGPENGTVWGWLEIENWTIYTEVSGPGVGALCPQPFVATVHDQGNAVIGALPANGPGIFANDSQEPTISGSNATGTPVVYYHQGFYASDRMISTCGTGTESFATSSNYVDIGLGFEYGGAWHVLNETTSVLTEYTYEFSANAGTWAVDNLSAPGGPGGGWSFSYLGDC
jgi:hypothetical protein